jgi:hypothetical protein
MGANARNEFLHGVADKIERSLTTLILLAVSFLDLRGRNWSARHGADVGDPDRSDEIPPELPKLAVKLPGPDHAAFLTTG